MHKSKLIKLLKESGDAIINYESSESKKFKYVVATLDFNNKHIQTKHNRAKETDDTLLVFCWDIDSFKLIKAEKVTSVIPLNRELKNEL